MNNVLLKNSQSKRNVFVWFALIFVICMGFLVGCQSTDKTNSYFNTPEATQIEFDYDEVSNVTNVRFYTTITNDTIYSFSGFSVTFKMYNDSDYVDTNTWDFSTAVKNGRSYSGWFTFDATGEIDEIQYYSWSANYNSFWETYRVWMIVTIVVASVVFLGYLIVMIVEDLELSDVFEWFIDIFGEHGYIGWSVLLFLIASGIFAIIVSYWVPLLIILGGLIAIVLLMLIAHYIKFIVEKIVEKVS